MTSSNGQSATQSPLGQVRLGVRVAALGVPHYIIFRGATICFPMGASADAAFACDEVPADGLLAKRQERKLTDHKT